MIVFNFAESVNSQRVYSTGQWWADAGNEAISDAKNSKHQSEEDALDVIDIFLVLVLLTKCKARKHSFKQ